MLSLGTRGVPVHYIIPPARGYVWTRGGYQVARTPDDYPLFIAVTESEFDAWTTFFSQFGLPATQERLPAKEVDGAIQIVLELQPDITTDMVDGRPVIPLEETVEYASEHYVTFESTLDVLDRMYDDVETDANYRMELD
nr:hypothetical protein [Haloarchaeobius salinus]